MQTKSKPTIDDNVAAAANKHGGEHIANLKAKAASGDAEAKALLAYSEHSAKKLAERDATNKPAKPRAKPAAKADKPAKPERTIYTTATTYTGASNLCRARTASASVMLNRSVGNRTDRDEAFNRAIRSEHGLKPFAGANYDAGGISRLIAHGDCAHVTGTGNKRSDGVHRYIDGGNFVMLKR